MLVRTYALRAVALVAVIAFALWLAFLAQDSAFFQNLVARFGYLGILLVSFASGFNVFFPVPAISFLPLYLESGLNFWVIILVISAGMSVADSIGYWLGRLGRDVATDIDKNKVIAFFDRIQIKHPVLAPSLIFLYISAAPLPNEVLVIPLGLMRFRFELLLPLLVGGNIVFNLLGAYGLLSIFNFLT